MNEENLKSRFKQMIEDGFQEIPPFEVMAPAVKKSRRVLLGKFLKYAAAIMLIGLMVYWIGSRPTAEQNSANMIQWEAPTSPLAAPIETEIKLYTWTSPTDFLMPKN